MPQNNGKRPKIPQRSFRGEPDSSVRYFSESPAYLTGQLHPYQLEGLNWLYHAFHQGQHVILADEMVSPCELCDACSSP